MKPTLTALGCAALVCATVALTATQAPPTSVEQRIARIDGHLVPPTVIKGQPVPVMTIAERMRFYKVPGVSIAVINNGAVEWARGHGVLEAGGGQPVTARTLFQAASISKPVAALAVLRLVEAGLVTLDEDVNSKLKSWKVPENEFTRQEKVTLRRILSHSAGLTVHGFPGYAADAPVPALVQVLDGAKPANTAAIRVDVVPGSVWRYSGGGYTVMQQLLLDMARRPFPVVMKDGVLAPLGMADSTYEQPLPDDLRARAASGHDAGGSAINGRYHTYPEMAAAGLWTTPSDLARFAIAIQQAAAGKASVLSQTTARQMLTPQKDTYGLGLSLSGSGASARFGHGGSNAGFQCQMTAYVETGQGAVVMTNGDRGGALAQEILRAIANEYGWPGYPGPKERTVATIDPAVFNAYPGRYEVQPGNLIVTVQLTGGRLMVSASNDPESTELLPESATRFFVLASQIDIEFVKGADGAVSHIMINGTIKARRLPGT